MIFQQLLKLIYKTRAERANESKFNSGPHRHRPVEERRFHFGQTVNKTLVTLTELHAAHKPWRVEARQWKEVIKLSNTRKMLRPVLILESGEKVQGGNYNYLPPESPAPKCLTAWWPARGIDSDAPEVQRGSKVIRFGPISSVNLGMFWLQFGPAPKRWHSFIGSSSHY